MVDTKSEVIDFHKQKLSIAKKAGDRDGEGRAYGNLGTAYHSLGNFKQAIECHTKRLSIAKEVGNRAGEGCAYVNLGNAYYSLCNFKQAIEYHKLHLSIAKEVGDRAGEGGAYGNLGNTYFSLGNFQQAIEYHKLDLSIAKEVGDRDGEGRAYVNLGCAYHRLGNVRQAIAYFKLHLNITKEVGDRAGEGGAYGNLGNAYHSLGNFKQAIEYHKVVLSIAKEMGDRTGEGRAYGGLGNACDSLGNFKQAIEYHKLDLSIAKEVGDRTGEGRAYGNLGNAYDSLGNFKQAIEYHKLSLSVAKDVGDRAGEGLTYGNLGSAYHSLGNFKQAIEYHKLGLSIAKEVGDRAGEGLAYGNLGNAYDSLGDFKQAIEYHNLHLGITKEVGDRDGEGRAYGNLGNAFHSLGNFKQAIEFQKRRLSIAKEVGARAEEGNAYGGLGNAYRSLGNFKQAIEYHKLCRSIAKEVGDRAGEGCAYGNLGNAYHNLGNFKQAIEYHKLDLSVAKEVGDSAGEGSACYSIGRDYESSGSCCEALDYYRWSVKHFDSTRALLQSQDSWKINFRDLYWVAYTALWRILLLNGETDEALCAAEQGRAQALMDILKKQYDIDVLPSTAVEPKETISYILNHVSAQTVFVALDENTINFWVLKKGNDVHFQRREIHPGSAALLMETTLKEIGAGVAVRCEDRSIGGLTVDPPSNREAVDDEAQPFTYPVDSLRPLNDVLIGPIADLLQGDQLIVVPDGPFCLAPYSALSDSVRIRTVPSLTALKLIAGSSEDYHSKSGALLVGDPDVSEVPISLSQLPCAKKEIEMIGKLLKTTPLTGQNATKGEVLKRITSVALVHIAAHGCEETGEIALAPNPGRASQIPEEEDYILKMSDVQAVRLKARLVVLSCCHSGRGEVKSEGVVGMARAFLCAGARSVLVSLWAIDDDATMQFMGSLYQHLADGRTASVALHQAMKSLRESEQFGAVKYWAPFVLIGDDVTLELGEQK